MGENFYGEFLFYQSGVSRGVEAGAKQTTFIMDSEYDLGY
jgi:hypothetical protein